MTVGNGFVHLLAAAAGTDPERVFARFEGTSLTFGELNGRAVALAAALRRRGLGAGSRIAVMLHNGPVALATMFGLAKAGAVWVPINVRLRSDGLRYVLAHAEPDLIVADADLAAALPSADTLPPIVRFGGGGSDRLEPMLDGLPSFNEPPPDGAAPFAISYTSGTTGPPKGVIVTHRMLRFAGEAAALTSAARDGDVLFVWEPLYHIGGSQLIVVPLIRRVMLAMVPRFSARRFWEQAHAAGATHVHYLGGVLQLLLKQPPGPLDRAHGVRVAWGGGCPPDVWRACLERFGVEIRECYGMTEASSITTFNDTGTIGAVGRPVPWFAVRIVDAQGRAALPHERGEIVVRAMQDGPLFPGYLRDAEATARVLRGGELYTGDLGSLDGEGRLVFHGRMTDSVRCRGEQVSAWEVEHVVAEHQDVQDCAMIGVAAEAGEQEIKLFVSLKPGSDLHPARLSHWLSERLAPYQQPRYIVVVDEFERTPSQRVMKHRLSRETTDGWDRLRDVAR